MEKWTNDQSLIGYVQHQYIMSFMNLYIHIEKVKTHMEHVQFEHIRSN